MPFSLGLVKKEQYKELFFGILCGIVTIPIGGVTAGLICGLKPWMLVFNLLPLLVLSGVLGAALIFCPKICMKCFMVFGYFMKTVAIIGLVCAIFTFLTKVEISPYFDTMENAAFVCVNACVTLSGMMPAMFFVAKVLNKPLHKLGAKVGINSIAAIGFVGSLVTNASTFGMMDRMDKKGAVLNAAFAVSASFVFGSHLAFTMAFDSSYITPMIVGKLVSGVCAVLLALLIYKETSSENA